MPGHSAPSSVASRSGRSCDRNGSLPAYTDREHPAGALQARRIPWKHCMQPRVAARSLACSRCCLLHATTRTRARARVPGERRHRQVAAEEARVVRAQAAVPQNPVAALARVDKQGVAAAARPPGARVAAVARTPVAHPPPGASPRTVVRPAPVARAARAAGRGLVADPAAAAERERVARVRWAAARQVAARAGTVAARAPEGRPREVVQPVAVAAHPMRLSPTWRQTLVARRSPVLRPS